jgi:N,N-dimethylformamidase
VTTSTVPGETGAAEIPLMGYPGGWSVRAGDRIDFMVSATVPSYRAEIVRVTGRGPRPDGDGPPLSFQSVPGGDAGVHPGRVQQTVSGSYAIAGQIQRSALGAGSAYAWVYPTLPVLGRWQAVITWLDDHDEPALELGLDPDGRPAVRYRRAGNHGDCGVLPGGVPLTPRTWHFVAASASPADGRVMLVHRQSGRFAGPATVVTARAELRAEPLGRRGYVAARRPAALSDSVTSVIDGSYNGKVDGPGVLPRALDAEALLRLAGAAVQAGATPAGALTGTELVNSPARPATGHNWTGSTLDWRACPAEYGAVWFHDDDLADAGWSPTFSWSVPEDIRSGMYAARLVAQDHEDVIPFYVRPAAGASAAPLAVLFPTFTYTIYSNFYHPARCAPHGSPDEVASAFLGQHRELGLSLYCKHRDGSGVCFVSSRRPMIDQRPGHRIVTRGNAGREVSGDLYLLDWLEHAGISYDAITDDDLHAEGAGLLRPYAGVVTGGHPEYTSEEMLDALASYLDGGGNLAYLGGNGFYWVTTVTAGAPHLLEVRRGRSGSRTWTGEPGEGHHSGGEPGGHWVDRGRAPQALVGVGFCAQGGGPGAGYDRTAGSHDPRAAFIFDGIGTDEIIGDFGLKLGGAAADELDRAEPALGTPPGTLIVATTRGKHDDSYQRAVEEVEEMTARAGGTQSEHVRADMTYLETPGGGSVFSVGSIAWSASLSYNGYDNNVAKITGNVLGEFARRGSEARP